MTKDKKELVRVTLLKSRDPPEGIEFRIEGKPNSLIDGKTLIKKFQVKKGERLFHVHPSNSMPDVQIRSDTKAYLREGATYYIIEANKEPKPKKSK